MRRNRNISSLPQCPQPTVVRLGRSPSPRFALAAWFLLAAVVLLSFTSARAAEPEVPLQYRLSEIPSARGVSAVGPSQEFVFGLPASLGLDSLAGISVDDLASVHDRPRATYRYTWFSQPGWDLKIGLSTTLDSASSWQRFALAPERMHTGALPTMHLSGQGQLSDRWLVSVNAEGLRTARGQGLDMDLRVDYSLNPNVALFGDYRMTDSSGDGAEIYGFVPTNAARLGLRLRF